MSYPIGSITIQLVKIREGEFVEWVKYDIDTSSRKSHGIYFEVFKFPEYSVIGKLTRKINKHKTRRK